MRSNQAPETPGRWRSLCHFGLRFTAEDFPRLSSISNSIARTQAGALDGRDMDKHVLATACRLNEAVTLLRIEPFHRGIWKPMGI